MPDRAKAWVGAVQASLYHTLVVLHRLPACMGPRCQADSWGQQEAQYVGMQAGSSKPACPWRKHWGLINAPA